MNFGEAWPFAWLLCKALQHQIVDIDRTHLRTAEQFAIFDGLDHLLVVLAVVRLATVTEDLVKKNTERPNIAFGAEFSEQNRLRRHPSDWQQTSRLNPIVVLRIDVSR